MTDNKQQLEYRQCNNLINAEGSGIMNAMNDSNDGNDPLISFHFLVRVRDGLLAYTGEKASIKKKRDAQHGGDNGLGIERLTIAFYGVQRLARHPLLV
jgi:hypothetical protein